MNHYTLSVATCCFAVLTAISFQTTSCHAKRHRSSSSSATCEGDACLLPKEHLDIYSNLKEALDSGFDISVKDLVPLLRSAEVLRRRYQNESKSDETTLARRKLVDSLLQNATLMNAMRSFNSDDGRALVNLYKSSLHGRSQNIACSQWQLDEILRASQRLESDKELADLFDKIHKNFVKKSAKKCLKQACNSIDLSMSQLDSVLRRSRRRASRDSAYTEDESSLSNFIDDSDQMTTSTDSGREERPSPGPAGDRREFADEESELCKFFGRSNETECRISGRELSAISLLGNNKGADGNTSSTDQLNLDDYLTSYALNRRVKTNEEMNSTASSVSNKDKEQAAAAILDQCRRMRPLLNYNMAAFKWYNANNVIDQQKLEVRLVWCPNLSYWMQIDRLCNEFEDIIDKVIIY